MSDDLPDPLTPTTAKDLAAWHREADVLQYWQFLPVREANVLGEQGTAARLGCEQRAANGAFLFLPQQLEQLLQKRDALRHVAYGEAHLLQWCDEAHYV